MQFSFKSNKQNGKKNRWKRDCQSRKRFTLFIPNEDINDIINIIRSLEDSNVLIDGITEKRNNLFRIKDGAYVINLDNKKSKGTHCILLFIDGNTNVYFDSLGIEYIPQEVFKKIRDKSITHNIFKIQSDDSITCGFYFIAFIEYMLAGKILLDYTNLFSQNDYKKKAK